MSNLKMYLFDQGVPSQAIEERARDLGYPHQMCTQNTQDLSQLQLSTAQEWYLRAEIAKLKGLNRLFVIAAPGEGISEIKYSLDLE